MALVGRSGSGVGVGADDGAGSTAGSDFTIIDAPKKQTTCLIFGDGGVGKTTFVTGYAPHPIAFINFDHRAYHAVSKASQTGRRVLYTHIDVPANISKMDEEAAKKIGRAAVDKFFKNFEWAVRESQRGNVRTIGIDTGTELGELFNLAIKGRPGGKSKDYGQSKDWTNRQWWQLFNTAREGNAHLVVLSRAKAIWENSEPTGYFTYRGPEVMFDAVDWAAQVRLARKVGVSRGGGGGVIGGGGLIGKSGGGGSKSGSSAPKEFELEIVKAGVTIDELGEVYSSRDWEDLGPFVYSCMLQYPGTLPEDWQ